VKALALLVLATAGLAAAEPPARIGPGTYRPMFPASPSEREVPVAAFRLDRTPVTNAQFLAFVTAHPAWQRDRVKALYADERYLSQWSTARDLGAAPANAPVVRVSWFAARAYCAAAGGRLPLEREWELAASASDRVRDASRDPAFQETVLRWYAKLAPAVLPDVGGAANAWGVRDLHGLVWEWVDDFNAALVTTDSRDPMARMFCGGAGATARDAAGYATFMRIAFRSSLDARATTAALGFRCAYDEVQ
jgi:formylglycine-generating enzyme required for sulfatase activity